jgi:hypothetical protein
VPPGRRRVRAHIGPVRRALPAALDVGRRRVRVVAPGSPAPVPRVVRLKRGLRRLARVSS